MKKFRITVNGQAYDVDVEEIKGGQAASPINTAPVQVAQNTTPSPAPVSSGGTGSTKVVAPMQGKIVAVNVSEGEMVESGDVVAILEAMKMENEIVASEAGTVATVDVAAGQAVDVGDLIISLN